MSVLPKPHSHWPDGRPDGRTTLIGSLFSTALDFWVKEVFLVSFTSMFSLILSYICTAKCSNSDLERSLTSPCICMSSLKASVMSPPSPPCGFISSSSTSSVWNNGRVAKCTWIQLVGHYLKSSVSEDGDLPKHGQGKDNNVSVYSTNSHRLATLLNHMLHIQKPSAFSWTQEQSTIFPWVV